MTVLTLMLLLLKIHTPYIQITAVEVYTCGMEILIFTSLSISVIALWRAHDASIEIDAIKEKLEELT